MPSRLDHVVAIALAMALVSAAAFAQPSRESIERANSLGNDFPTPHTRWGKPLSGGNIRTLFIVHQSPSINVLPLRHVVELQQRFDLSCDAVLAMTAKGKTYAITYQGGAGVYGGATGAARLARLLETPYDCYVVTGPVMGHLPEKSRKAILKEVDRGAGLVLLYKPEKEDSPLLKKFADWGDTPGTLSGLKVKCFRMGKGRIVSVERYPADATWDVYRPNLEQRIFGFNLCRDLFYEAQGRAILWAANREPRMAIGVELGFRNSTRDELASRMVKLTWNDRAGKVPGQF